MNRLSTRYPSVGADHRTDRVAFLIKNAQATARVGRPWLYPSVRDRIDDERVWASSSMIDCFFMTMFAREMGLMKAVGVR